ncbi:MAG: hypothetical protein JW940_20650 [Polyangiaceae bacterium]|nr:hypothetical protein [Polyangiaceae bacterium]
MARRALLLDQRTFHSDLGAGHQGLKRGTHDQGRFLEHSRVRVRRVGALAQIPYEHSGPPQVHHVEPPSGDALRTRRSCPGQPDHGVCVVLGCQAVCGAQLYVDRGLDARLIGDGGSNREIARLALDAPRKLQSVVVASSNQYSEPRGIRRGRPEEQ